MSLGTVMLVLLPIGVTVTGILYVLFPSAMSHGLLYESRIPLPSPQSSRVIGVVLILAGLVAGVGVTYVIASTSRLH